MRVGFSFYPQGPGSRTPWLGGVNYFRNLFRALKNEPSGIEPVVFVPSGGEGRLPSDFPPVEVVPTSLLRRHSLPWAARMGVREVLGTDLLLALELRRHGVSLLSHSGPLGPHSPVPATSWIPDFQHRRLPQFFSSSTRKQRDRAFAKTIEQSSLVIVSSDAARHDLSCFYPEHAAKARVLRFADCTAGDITATGLTELRQRYGLKDDRFLLLPNQFWAHKNHRTVIRALGLLRRSRRDVVVLATGDPHDPRQPEFFQELMQERKKCGAEACFRVLGVVPFADLAGLMRNAVAVINPSLFEGWSTSVEESKSLGKLLVLSSIAVHHEQNPARGLYFEPLDEVQLAEQLWSAWEAFDPALEPHEMTRAQKQMVDCRRDFSAAFASIAREASERI